MNSRIPRSIPSTHPKTIYRDTELERAVIAVQNNDYKIVLIKMNTFPYTSTHICNTKFNNKQTPLVWVRSLLPKIAKKHSQGMLVSLPSHSNQPFIPSVREETVQIKNDGSMETVRFPVVLDPKLTVEDYKKIVLEELDFFIKEKELDLNYRSIIGLIGIHQLFGQTFLDQNSEVKFLKAILELSKKHTVIMADPMNVFDLPPTGVVHRVHQLKKQGHPATPYNTAHLMTQNIADEIIAEAVLIVLHGLK